MTDTQDTKTPSRSGWLTRLSGRFRSRKSATETDALALPPMGRGAQTFSALLFFLAGVALTAFALANPLGMDWLPDRTSTGSEVVAHSPDNQAGQLYQCPMHPEVLEAEQVDCPICHMKLMPVSSTDSAPPALYTCPMHPEVLEHEPGDCPLCGMALLPTGDSVSGAGDSSSEIQIDPVQIQNTGVVSQAAELGSIARTVRTVGILDFNAKNIRWINVKFEGWVEKVYVNYVGQKIVAGQPLFEIYSPDLVTTQEEYLRALSYRDSLAESGRPEVQQQAASLLRSTRERLHYWDVSDEQIARLEREGLVQRRLTISAAAEGVVTQVMNEALEGMYVKPGMNVYKIADVSSLWVHADVYESDLPWVRVGQGADVSFNNQPDRTIRGKVLFLYPEVSKETRTLKICVQIPNANGRLRAGMYSDVVLHGPTINNTVLIPNAAVLRSGQRNLVFVDLGDGRFSPRPVTLGLRDEGNRVQILEGLEPGEAVVTQAQFMLDSESRLQEAIAKFRERKTASSEDGN